MKQIVRIITIFLLTIAVAKAQDFVFSPLHVLHGLSDNQVRFILQLPDGRMVFKTSGNINIYDGAHFKYIHQNARHVYPLTAYNGFYRIYQGKDSLLWIKDNHKLMCVDLRTEKYLADLDSYFKKTGFKRPVDDVFMDSEQRLWLLSTGKLLLQDKSWFLDLSANQGVLQDLASDKDAIYLFYNTGTVVCYDLKTKSKRYSVAAYPASQQDRFRNTSLVVKGDYGFYQLRNGSQGGFFFFDTRKRIWKKILETAYTLNTLVLGRDHNAAVSCANGIWMIDIQSGKKRYLPALKKRDGSILNTEISTIFYDRQDGLWLGTLNQGLLYYHPARYMFIDVGRKYFPEVSAKDIVVQSFAEDPAGNIYIKCRSSVYRYRAAANHNISLELVNVPSLPQQITGKLNQNTSASNHGNNTAQLSSSNGWRWTGTADGLKVFNPRTRKERIFYTKDGLSNNFIHGILQDHHNNIWITTSYGINKVRIAPESEKIHFIKFGHDAGTLEGEYTDGAVFESRNGTLYFGGINGFSMLKPGSPIPKKLPFKPVFTNLFLRGERIQSGHRYDGRIILKKSPPYTRSIELSYNQNFITFEFSALNYQNPSQTYYRYQLRGIDQGWRELSDNREEEHLRGDGILNVSYTNLPHGKYTLLVMASNNNREWNGPVSELHLSIQAPWWKTTLASILFLAISLSIILALVFGYMRNVRKKLKRKHQEDILLLKIRNLIDQCNTLQAEKENSQAPADPDSKSMAHNDRQNQAESAFLARALAQVENNLNVPDYSVEQLSRDLHMDRTGLYRKLVTLLDKSPSLFIRNIRLEKAAALILEGELNISEITEKVGFSSSSYLSKCFQERYGCRPSEYAKKAKKST